MEKNYEGVTLPELQQLRDGDSTRETGQYLEKSHGRSKGKAL